jgi:methylenetetrahydrofolate reductase (NADPH)
LSSLGYPEGHIDAESFDKDLQYLKEKVDAGADLIITQLFYDTDLFIEWVRKCRKIGITVPILPGIMPIQSYVGFMRMTQLCRTKVPQEIYDALEPIQNDDAKVKEYGVSLAVKMCSKILAADVGISGLHFYTLNLEKSVTDILEQLQLITSPRGTPVLPFKNHRPSEDVRPVFWVNRPKSYLSRTAQWDEFPNGRWGDTRSAAYGDLTDYHLSALHFKVTFSFSPH